MKKTFYSILSFFILLIATPVFAIDYPTIKQGLWKMTASGDGHPGGSVQVCMGDKASLGDIVNRAKKMGQGMCEEAKIQKVGDSYVTKNQCDFGIAKASIESVASGDFNSEYTIKTKSIVSNINTADRISNSLSHSKYLGACTKGMKAGDMIMPDGKKINVDEETEKAMKSMKKMDPKKLREMKARLEKMQEGISK